MKKIIAIALALVMVFAMANVALALIGLKHSWHYLVLKGIKSN